MASTTRWSDGLKLTVDRLHSAGFQPTVVCTDPSENLSISRQPLSADGDPSVFHIESSHRDANGKVIFEFGGLVAGALAADAVVDAE
jgi:hypothetical protein